MQDLRSADPTHREHGLDHAGYEGREQILPEISTVVDRGVGIDDLSEMRKHRSAF